MKKIIYLFVILTGMAIISCEEEEGGITDAEIVQGLKEALKIGTDSSVSIVSALDGYYKDALIKILLPDEAANVYDEIKNPSSTLTQTLQTLGVLGEIDNLFEDVILGINRSAEYAADTVSPIFWNAITSMSIADGKTILYGADNAATTYLQKETNDQIKVLFKPVIKKWLDKPLLKSTSTNDLWVSLTKKYNTAANSIAGQIAGIKPIPEEATTEEYLADHSTQKALDGLFVKVADEEKNIRKNPLERVTGILQKVFGMLD